MCVAAKERELQKISVYREVKDVCYHEKVVYSDKGIIVDANNL